MYPICNFKDRLMPLAEAHVSLDDLGLLRGYGIFDFLRTYHLKPFLLEAYLERFYQSASEMLLEVPVQREEMLQLIPELLQRNEIKEDVGIRLLLTGGPSEDSVSVHSPLLYIVVEPLHPQPASAYTKGVKLVTLEHMRIYPHIKTTSYIAALRNIPKVKQQGAVDSLYTWQGRILETTRNNFFAVLDGKLVTAGKDILIGRTRNFVLGLARELAIPIQERDIKIEELPYMQEAFITGTTKSITPVVMIDEMRVGEGWPGPVTQHLMKAFEEKIGIRLYPR